MNLWLPTIRTATGAETYARALAAGLTARGHRVQLDFAPHRYQYAPWLFDWKRPERCDAILANSWSSAALPRIAPLVTVVHHVVHGATLSPYKTTAQRLFHRLFVKPMEEAAIRASTEVVAVSETTRQAIAAELSPGPVETVLNGIDTDFFCPGAERERPPGTPLELLFVGKPSRRKGFDLVHRIITQLGGNCRFTCIGPNAERAMPLPPGDYRGRVSRTTLREAMRGADFLLLPSRVEGFGYAAAEAMACGTPVVCAPEGAVAEICMPPAAAITVDEATLESGIEIMRAVAADRGRHDTMRAAARTIAVERLSEQRWLDGMEAVLARAAGE